MGIEKSVYLTDEQVEREIERLADMKTQVGNRSCCRKGESV